MLSGKRIILGVTGGIAAYKAAFLLRAYQKAGAEVRVTMTPAATKFVGIETFSSLSKHPVAVDVFPESDTATDSWVKHISWGEWADLFVIAPCTANTLGKIAYGLSDNMLTTTVLAARCPMLICPTMDGVMYEAPAVQKNIHTLKEFGYHILEPEKGYLASGIEGKGRLPETETILEKSDVIIQPHTANGPLAGKKVVVTAGPTREYIDPVRFISNPSTGKMGFAMAEAARQMGAEITLIHGPVTIAKPAGITAIEIESAQELFEQIQNYAHSDIIIMTAAVSDFTLKQTHQQKIKKESAEASLKLERTPDILAWLGKHKKEGQVLIGFAMETENLLENARKKLERKNADWIVANSLNVEESGFASDKNKVHLLGKKASVNFEGLKSEVARKLLTHIFSTN